MKHRWLTPILVVLIAVLPAIVATPVTIGQEFPHVEATKTVDPTRTQAGATLQVTVLLRGAGGSIHTPVDVVLIIDKSGSMQGKKITDAKEAAKTFLDYTDEKDRVGLITFSTNVESVSPLTFMTSPNKASFESKVNSIQALGSTDIFDAVVAADGMLLAGPRSNAPLVEVLLTDGNHNWPSLLPDSAFQDLANHAKAKDIIIYTVGLGSDVSARRLRLMAETTGGIYYFAATSDQLKTVYQTIGSKLAFAGTNIKVTETIPSYLTYNGDASGNPSTRSSGNGLVLEWHLTELKVGEEWQATYTARAQRAVETVSAVVHTKVEYMTSESALAIINLTPGIAFHDIAVLELTATPDSVEAGQIVRLEITVKNLGAGRESFDLRTGCDGSVLDSRSMALNGGETTTVTIQWNTTNVEAGKYQVVAEADPNGKIWEANRTDNKAQTTVDVLGTAASGFLLLVAFMTLLTVAVGGVAYTRPRFKRVGYICPVDRVPLKYSYTARRWYCPRCRRPYRA